MRSTQPQSVRRCYVFSFPVHADVPPLTLATLVKPAFIICFVAVALR